MRRGRWELLVVVVVVLERGRLRWMTWSLVRSPMQLMVKRLGLGWHWDGAGGADQQQRIAILTKSM